MNMRWVFVVLFGVLFAGCGEDDCKTLSSDDCGKADHCRKVYGAVYEMSIPCGDSRVFIGCIEGEKDIQCPAMLESYETDRGVCIQFSGMCQGQAEAVEQYTERRFDGVVDVESRMGGCGSFTETQGLPSCR